MAEPEQAEVRAINARADRPEDALARVHEALAGGAKAIMVVTVSADGDVDTRYYGTLTRGAMAWAGAAITREALED